MTIEQIKEMVNGSAYDFLRTNEHLGSKIIFLTLGGSYSYGTNVETSSSSSSSRASVSISALRVTANTALLTTL